MMGEYQVDVIFQYNRHAEADQTQNENQQIKCKQEHCSIEDCRDPPEITEDELEDKIFL